MQGKETEDSGHFEITRFVYKRRRVDKTLTLEDKEKDEEMVGEVKRSERNLLESDEENQKEEEEG